LILFFDENIPPKVAASLQALGSCEARHLVDHLPRGSSDEQIFQLLADRGWFLVTQDYRIKRNPHQRQALLQAGLGAFILTGRADRSKEEMMIFILECLPNISELGASTGRPFIYGISDKRRFERLG
jgi:predicted nuclease of predicted toxin-antitoxin system